MGEYSQIGPTFREKGIQPVERILYNPQEQIFTQVARSASFSVFDVGCGKNAYVSWELDNNKQLLVACDPLIDEYSFKNARNKLGSKKGSYIFIKNEALSVYRFRPDVISLVAPNQSDVAEGLFFDLDKFLGDKKQYIFSVLDTRTHEAEEKTEEAKQNIKDWMKDSKFSELYNSETEELNEVIEDLEVDLKLPCHFSPKSGDLGSRNILIVGIRNPK
jgi:hypothetical protein